MGKSKTGISKSERTMILIRLFAKAKKLRKSEIDQRFAELANVDPQDVSRLLHDDLKSLVENHGLLVRYFNPDGSEADENSKNKIGEWYIEENSKDKILGYGDLVSSGYSIQVSRLMYSYTTFDSIEKQNSVTLGILIKGKIAFLNIDLDARPFKVVIARNINVAEEIPFEEIEGRFGRRTIFLGIPNSNVSSLKRPEKNPHIEINVSEKNIELRDYDSTNGSFFKEVSESHYRNKISKIISASNQTQTQTVFSIEQENSEEKVAETFTFLQMNTKLGVIFLSKTFCFSIIKMS